MRTAGKNFLGALLFQRLGHIDQRPAGIDHVIDNDARSSGDLTDDVHHLNGLRVLAPLVNDGQGCSQALGKGAGALHPAGVRGDHGGILDAQGAEIVHGDRRRIEVVHGNVEITLNLAGVQVERQNPVSARGGQQVRHELGGDGHTRAVLAVLPRVSVVRHHRGDAIGRGPLERVQHDQQFHQIVVHRG